MATRFGSRPGPAPAPHRRTPSTNAATPAVTAPATRMLRAESRGSELAHYRVPRLEQNVLWLEVAVHYVAAVGVAQGVRHFLDDLYGLLERELPLPLQSLAQRLALDVRHHVVQGALGSAGVVQRQDVGVGEPRRDL